LFAGKLVAALTNTVN